MTNYKFQGAAPSFSPISNKSLVPFTKQSPRILNATSKLRRSLYPVPSSKQAQELEATLQENRIESFFKPTNLPIVPKKSFVELDADEVMRSKQRASHVQPGLKKFFKHVIAASRFNLAGNEDYQDGIMYAQNAKQN